MPAIHTREPALILRAGDEAIAHIREHGLRAEDIEVLPGAAGGPKGIGIAGLDQAIFGDFLSRAPRRRTLIWASIGSWRFAAVASGKDGAARSGALARLAELYTRQRFPKGITAHEVTRRCAAMLSELLDEQDLTILDNPDYRLVVVVIRSRGLMTRDGGLGLGLGLAGVIGGNLLSRRALGAFMERGLVYTGGQDNLPLAPLADFATHHVPLTADNLRAALLASAAIPMVLEGVRDIPGAPPGVYRDGGMLDYHLDLPYRTEGLVLYPHFTDRVIPGWFDKPLRWRNGDPGRLSRTVLVSPSPQYLASLPHGKLPDRTDFKRYLDDDAGRERYWRMAIDESRRLGDEFLQLVESGRCADRLHPLLGRRPAN
ncbi:patatin-like phospholipase family protein [Alloalcanivorax xenomutans]|uniref:patatin-like phospholipase family protein n=1 Tax=Alloalcanivorax xenomutans TaxID=1094342 RepID=UPI003008466A